MASDSGLADTPWPMFGHDPQHTGRSPYNGPEVPAEKWSFTTESHWGGYGFNSSPAIAADGTIYIGSGDQDGKLYAVTPDGLEKWSFTTEGRIYSTPAIAADGTIYVGSTDKKLYAITPDGSEKWSFTTGDSICSSPVIAAVGTIYVGSSDDKLYAINPDGSFKWSFTTYSYFAGGGVSSSPAIASDGTIYVGSDSYDKSLYAINPDGSLKWSFTTGGGIYSSPVTNSNGTIYAGSRDGNLYAINPDGSEKWSFDVGNEVDSSPAIAPDSTIYVGSSYFGDKLYAINPDGTEKWSFDTGGSITSAPTIASDGTIYVAPQGKKLYAINPDGTENWSLDTGNSINCRYSSPVIGTNSIVYIGSNANKFHAIGEAPIESNSGILDQIQDDVSKWRGLSALANVERHFITSDELQQNIIGDIGEGDIEEMTITQEVLVLMDLMDEEQDLYEIFLDLYSEGVAGFYNEETDEIYVLGDTGELSAAEEKTYAHEYTHALQDQHFDLSSLGLDTDDNSDLSMAIRSLVEGDAELLEELYYWQVFDAADREAYDQEIAEYDVEALLEGIPDVILQDFMFPYTAGMSFVYTLCEEGGWDAVNAAYSNLPQSTEQIIHPEKYLEGDEPQSVTLPDLESALDGWARMDTDVLGELYMILYLNAFLDMDQAKAAAEGWGGDRYAFLKDSEDKKLLVMDSVWDSTDDAVEFFGAYIDFMEAKTEGTWDLHQEKDRIRWWQTEGSSVYLRQNEEDVLLIIAPDESVVEQVLIEFTDSDKGNGGGWFDCSCGSKESSTSATALLTGWGIIGLCWGGGYYLVRRKYKGVK